MKPSPLTPLLRLLGESLAAGGRRRWFAVLAIVAVVGLLVWRPELLQQEPPAGSGRVAREQPTEDAPSTVDRSTVDRSIPAPSPPLQTPPGNRGAAEVARAETPAAKSPSSPAVEPDRGSRERVARDDNRLSPRTDAAANRPQVTIPRGGEPYRSPAGLVYTRGSAQGHRLRHVLEHGEDVPDRPGSHGVFQSNDLTEIVALIDEAYDRARQGRGTQRREEEGRTVLTVDMGRSIGYIGGQSGNRRGRPQARHLRMVLEDSRVITAYPIVP